MPISITGDLRQMRDAKNLVPRREAAKLFADDRTEASADVGVDFIEYQHAHAIALRENSLEREHDARKLAAGSDFAQRLRELSGVGLHGEFNLIDPRREWFRRIGKINRKTSFFHPQFCKLSFDQWAQ